MRIVILAVCIWSCQAANERGCGEHPIIANGDFYAQPGTTELEAQCALLYTLKGPERVKCVNGKWSETPVCLSPCKVNQKLFYSTQNPYMRHGEEMRGRCWMNGWIDVRCDSGTASYRGCGYYDWGRTYA